MSQAIDDYIDQVGPEWQAAICRALHATVHRAVPDTTDRLQYGKPHYLKGGKYVAGMGTAKGWVAFTIFNAAGIDAPPGCSSRGHRSAGRSRSGRAGRSTTTCSPDSSARRRAACERTRGSRENTAVVTALPAGLVLIGGV